MNINEMDLNLLVAFDALFLERNVTRAGKKIGLSQPAMSNALSRLREFFSDMLFVRTSQGMQPTSRAQELAHPIRQALDLIQTSFQKNSTIDYTRSERTFNLVMSDYCQFIVLPRLVEWLKTSAPNISLRVYPLQEKQLQQAMESGDIDLVIGVSLKLKSGIYQQKLFEEKFASMVRSEHPKVKNKVSLRQYTEMSHALVSLQGQGSGIVDEILKKRGLKRKVMLQVPHFLVIPMIIAKTDLIVTIPERVANTFSPLMDLKLLTPPIHIPEFSITQYWHERHHNDPFNQWLRHLILRLSDRF